MDTPRHEAEDASRHEAEDAQRDELLEHRGPDDEQVAEMLEHTIDVPVLADTVERQAAADAADILETLDDEDAVDVIEEMEDQAAALALAKMEGPLAAGVLLDLVEEGKADYAAHLLELMAPDDAADLLQEVDDDERQPLLEALGTDVEDVVELLQYDEESAGGIMTTDVLAVRGALSVAEATDFIRSSPVPDQTRFALVVDDDERLLGVIGLRRLLLAQPDEMMRDLARPSSAAIHPDLDREQVAREFDRYDYEMIPVIDDEGRLLGIVTVDDVIDIIRAEHTEDVQKTVGAGAGEAVYSGVVEKVRGRMPWLVVSLIMTCGAALVVLFFEGLVREHTVLAFLLPVIAALVGNAGHQALAVTLRGIVLEEVRRDRVTPLIGREAITGLLNGIVLGVMIAGAVAALGAAGVQSADWNIGLIAGVATLTAMSVGTLSGSLIPLLMRRLGFDPAQSSAIFLIMITDGVSFSSLLGLVAVLVGTTA